MDMRISRTALKSIAFSFLMLGAAGLALPGRRVLAAGHPQAGPLVRGISIHHAPDGAVTIDIALTGPAPYRTLQLSGPERLVVDLQGAHETDLKGEYPADSQLLKQVRASQWKTDPAVVRIVADLRGHPSVNLAKQASGIRIELKPRGAELASNHNSGGRPAKQAADTLEPERRTAQEAPLPGKAFQVHRFKDLSASLTAPVLPSHDKLVPVADPDLAQPRRKKASTLALVSGISVLPGSQGETTIDIASSKSVPYRVFQLANPFRLVIDLKGARDASRQDVYQVDSPVLKRVRVGQWSPANPSVVRVVADLEGYPIFDVHAQRPGIRIELRPRYVPGALMRNPFQFKTAPQRPRSARLASASNQAVAADGGPAAAAPGGAFSGLKVIGFIEKKGAGTQAVISHHSSVFLVPQGGTFENTFTVVAIMPDAVVVQDLETREKRVIAYSP